MVRSIYSADMDFFRGTRRPIKTRKNFPISTKKIEWNKAAGRSPSDFNKRSYCRSTGCAHRALTWGKGGYEFDHKDNNNSNNAQSNCYLVCSYCHSRVTKVKKKKVKDMFGNVIGHKTYKKKVGYKTSTRQKRTKKSRRSTRRNPFGSDMPAFRPPKFW